MNLKSIVRTLLALVTTTMVGTAQGQLTFTTNGGTITITGYSGSDGQVVIPNATNGLAVTAIGNSAFANHADLTSVTIPESVTDIGLSAFENCNSLTNVTLGSGVKTIREHAFAYTGLTGVRIPRSVYSNLNRCLHALSAGGNHG